MSDLIQIVDEGDQLIAHKNRAEVDYEHDIYRVAALWLTNSRNEVLIAQRKLTKDKDPGKWGPAVAGTVDEGEEYESNIIKETEEEIGITGLSLDLGPKQFITEPRKYFLQWFLAESDLPEESFTPQESEVEKVKWINVGELIKDVTQNPQQYVPVFPAAIKELVK